MTATRKPGRPVDVVRQERRRGEILAAAAKLFAENGYAKCDTQQLADGLGISKGTVFRYFPTKRALFVACIERAMDQLRAQVDGVAAKATDPLDKLALAIVAYLRFFDRHPEVVELLILERAELKDRKSTYFDRDDRRAESERGWRRVVVELVSSGRFRVMPPDRILEFIGDLLYGTIFSNHMSGRRRSLASRGPGLLDIVVRALRADARDGSQKASAGVGVRRHAKQPMRRKE